MASEEQKSSEGEMRSNVDSVQVAVRVRPLTGGEIGEGCDECVQALSANDILVDGGSSGPVGPASGASSNRKTFCFDKVFDSRTNQSAVYEGSVVPLLERFLQGYNATVLAYGQTGSGKTHTMLGEIGKLDDAAGDGEGVIPRVARALFEEAAKREPGSFSVKVSFLEIYKEGVRDLLGGETVSVREDAAGRVVTRGLVEKSVHSASEMLEALREGSLGRVVGGTDMNAQSSRSHAVFTVSLEQVRVVEEEGEEEEEEEVGEQRLHSKFHLVDLAGSERQRRTGASGNRLREAAAINRGLLSLGSVIKALTSPRRKGGSSHVPYRDSKLTFLLKDSLGGNSATLMIACVSPADSNIDESTSTLMYAQRARRIRNHAVRNEDPAAAQLSFLRRQVRQLQRALLLAQSGASEDVQSFGGGGTSFVGGGGTSFVGGGGTSSDSKTSQSPKAHPSAHALAAAASSLAEGADPSMALASALERSAMVEQENIRLRRQVESLQCDLHTANDASSAMEQRLAEAERLVDKLKSHASTKELERFITETKQDFLEEEEEEEEEKKEEDGELQAEKRDQDKKRRVESIDFEVSEDEILREMERHSARQRSRQAELAAVTEALREKEALFDALATAGASVEIESVHAGLPASVDVNALAQEIAALEEEHRKATAEFAAIFEEEGGGGDFLVGDGQEEGGDFLVGDGRKKEEGGDPSKSAPAPPTSTPTKSNKRPSSSKHKPELERKVKELEDRLLEARSKLRDAQRMRAMRDKAEAKAESLGNEISALREARSRVARAMREDAKKFREQSRIQEKKLSALRASDAKSRVRAGKAETLAEKRAVALRIKTEKLLEARRRAREAEQRAKAVAKEASRVIRRAAKASSASASAAASAAASEEQSAIPSDTVFSFGDASSSSTCPALPHPLDTAFAASSSSSSSSPASTTLMECIRREVSIRLALSSAESHHEDLIQTRKEVAQSLSKSSDSDALHIQALGEEIAAVGSYIAELRDLRSKGVRVHGKGLPKSGLRWAQLLEQHNDVQTAKSLTQWIANVSLRLSERVVSEQSRFESLQAEWEREKQDLEEETSALRTKALQAEAASSRAAREAEEKLLTVLGVRLGAVEREESKKKEEEEEEEGAVPSVDEIAAELSSDGGRKTMGGARSKKDVELLRAQLESLASVHEEYAKEAQARQQAEDRAAELEIALRSASKPSTPSKSRAMDIDQDSSSSSSSHHHHQKPENPLKTTSSSSPSSPSSPAVVYLSDDFDPDETLSDIDEDDPDDSDWEEDAVPNTNAQGQQQRNRRRKPTSTSTTEKSTTLPTSSAPPPIPPPSQKATASSSTHLKKPSSSSSISPAGTKRPRPPTLKPSSSSSSSSNPPKKHTTLKRTKSDNTIEDELAEIGRLLGDPKAARRIAAKTQKSTTAKKTGGGLQSRPTNVDPPALPETSKQRRKLSKPKSSLA